MSMKFWTASIPDFREGEVAWAPQASSSPQSSFSHWARRLAPGFSITGRMQWRIAALFCSALAAPGLRRADGAGKRPQADARAARRGGASHPGGRADRSRRRDGNPARRRPRASLRRKKASQASARRVWPWRRTWPSINGRRAWRSWRWPSRRSRSLRGRMRKKACPRRKRRTKRRPQNKTKRQGGPLRSARVSRFFPNRSYARVT